MGWEEAVWRAPLKGIMLLLRERCWQDDSGQLTLQDKEAIDRWQNIH